MQSAYVQNISQFLGARVDLRSYFYLLTDDILYKLARDNVTRLRRKL